MHTVDQILRIAARSIVLLSLASMPASADSTPSPTGTLVAEPEGDQPQEMIGRGYFELAMGSGQERSVRVTVQNTSTEPMTVRAYPVDGIPLTGGGIAFNTFDQPAVGSGMWVSVDEPNMELAPGESRRVTATIKVAEGATPGDHVAGIAVENARPRPSSSNSQMVINVFYRRAIAVIVAVPGERTTSVEVDTVALSQDGQGNHAVVQVRNTGNSLLKAKGTLEIGGSEASSVPQAFSVDTLIPSTGTGIPVPLPGMKLTPGIYNAHVSLQAEDGHALADWQGSALFSVGRPAEPTAVPATVVSLAPVVAAPRAAATAVADQATSPAAAGSTPADQDGSAIARSGGATSSAGFWVLLGVLALLLVGLKTAFAVFARRSR